MMTRNKRHLRRLVMTLLPALAILFAVDGDATSLTEQKRFRTEDAVADEEGLRLFSGMAGVETPADAIPSEKAAAWNDIGEDAWPERDFSAFLDVLPALYGIRDAQKLSDSFKLSDSSFSAPSVDSRNPLLENADTPDWNVRPRYALTAAELREQLQQARPPRLVDLRRQEDVAQFRLAGSLNIPRFALTTKGFLKRRPFVLLDEGYEPQALETLCEELQQTGLEASFLYGGLKAWKDSGGELEGDRFAQDALDRLPAWAFREGLTDARRLIVTLDTSLPRTDFPQAVALPSRSDPQDWLTRLERTLAQWTDRPELFSVVLVSRHGNEYDDLEHALRNSRLPNIFFLEGGWQAYQNLLSRELVARERGTASTDAPAGCPNCRLGCQ